MFRWFETRIEAFPEDPPTRPPDTLLAFYAYFIKPVWPAFAVLLVAGFLGSLIEVVNRFGSFFYGSILGVFLLAMIPRARALGAFVGLIAPHAARALVGSAHHRFVPLAILLGAALVGTADLLGRRLIYPEQLPAGIMTSLVGVPYFILLVLQSRRRAR